MATPHGYRDDAAAIDWADGCGNVYPVVGGLPASNKWSSTKSLGSVTTVCGDLQLLGHVMVNAPSDAVLIIRNGQLAMNGCHLGTAAGSGLAVVFTGTNNAAYQHRPTGPGALDITAPTTGIWSGVALAASSSSAIAGQRKGSIAYNWAPEGVVATLQMNPDRFAA